MAITYNSQEAKAEKKPQVYQGFTYDTETDGGCIDKFTTANSLIMDVSNDIEALGEKYNALQAKYDKFTDFNEQMNSNKRSLRTSVDNIRKGFEEITNNLNSQVAALQKQDAGLITDLEAIDKLISIQQENKDAIKDSRTKTDSGTGSSDTSKNDTSKKSDDEISQVADDVIKGKYGTGDERKEALKKLGYDPDEVQKKVNEKLKGGGSSDSSQTPSTETPQPSSGDNSSRPNESKDTSGEAGYVGSEADTHQGTGQGPTLNSHNGTVDGPSGKETYYNLDMSKIVKESQPGGWIYNQAKANGNEANLSGNIWTRDDGCKMMGDYIMVAADLNVHPRGSLVQTSLGIGVVVDTGDFAKTNHNQIDIATTW